MSIYIKGMEMPKNCAECPVNMNICKRGYKYLLAHMELYDERAKDCPITPVPPHGRLIDADALKESIHSTDTDERKILSTRDLHHALIGWINNRPTIIPAEEGET